MKNVKILKNMMQVSFLIMFIMITIVISIFVNNSYALDNNHDGIILDCPENININGTITCYISANFATFTGTGISAKYNFSSNLDYVSFSYQNIFSSYYDSSNGFALVSNNTELKGKIQVGTLTLKLNSQAKEGENCTVTLIEVDTSDNTDNFASHPWSSVESTIYIYNDNVEEPSTNYKVIYDANGGSDAPSVQNKVHDVNLTLSHVIPWREGYTFLGWNTNKNATTATYSAGDVYENNEDITLYAVWNVNEYTISYNANGGSGAPNAQTKTHGVNLTLSNTKPVRDGYKFLGWAHGTTVNNPTYNAGGVYTANASAILYAVWEDPAGELAPPIQITYEITYDANGGSSAPSVQTGNTVTISSTIPIKRGYTFVGWNTNRDGSGTNYNQGDIYVGEPTATLYAQWVVNSYKINYSLNAGSGSDLPSEGTYDSVVDIKNPSKTVTIHGNVNGTDAFVGNDTSSVQEFAGWTSSTIDTSTAYYDNTPWTDGNTKVTATSFKNLTVSNDGTVIMIANWDPVYITLPVVMKVGYTCNWNTRADGSGNTYPSGGKYLPVANSSSIVNLYAECLKISGIDEEKINPPQTGDILIVLAWIIGICSLGYSVYYLRSRKVD